MLLTHTSGCIEFLQGTNTRRVCHLGPAMTLQASRGISRNEWEGTAGFQRLKQEQRRPAAKESGRERLSECQQHGLETDGWHLIRRGGVRNVKHETSISPQAAILAVTLN